MQDVSDVFAYYRIWARAIWNMIFGPDPSFSNWDYFDAYEDIRRILFDALVLSKLSIWFNRKDIFREPMRFFSVSPRSSYPSIPIMISNPRPNDNNRYFDEPLNLIGSSEAELHFVDYFDWTNRGYLDFEFCEVRIASFPGRPDLVGREALVKPQHVSIFFDSNAIAIDNVRPGHQGPPSSPVTR